VPVGAEDLRSNPFGAKQPIDRLGVLPMPKVRVGGIEVHLTATADQAGREAIRVDSVGDPKGEVWAVETAGSRQCMCRDVGRTEARPSVVAVPPKLRR
jgi:hypothetical protein